MTLKIFKKSNSSHFKKCAEKRLPPKPKPMIVIIKLDVMINIMKVNTKQRLKKRLIINLRSLDLAEWRKGSTVMKDIQYHLMSLNRQYSKREKLVSKQKKETLKIKNHWKHWRVQLREMKNLGAQVRCLKSRRKILWCQSHSLFSLILSFSQHP